MEANASGMICARCGTPNGAGDAFCGSCGAFLEFAAQDVGAPEVGAAEPSAAEPLLAGTGPTCPVCGRANPAGRTFCISCGERLAAAGRPVAAPAPPFPGRAVLRTVGKTPAAGSPTTQAAISEIRLHGMAVTP
jgi:Double zinc ribbon